MVAMVENAEKIEFWHCKLGHMSKKGMKILVTNDMISKIKSMEHHTYESCILGKKKRVSFSNARR